MTFDKTVEGKTSLATARRQIFQCNNCRQHLNYQPERVDVNPCGYGPYEHAVGWCDECLSSIKSKLTKPPQPINEAIAEGVQSGKLGEKRD